MYLYVDSSKGLCTGLLDADFKWLHFSSEAHVKSSATLHWDIYNILGLEVTGELQGVFVISGPGSYTGMRVSEGLAQIFEWAKFPVWSFYHFQVPWIIGVEKGLWICDAYKGELFKYSWKGESSEIELIKKEDLEHVDKNGRYSYFGLADFAVDGLTEELIQENPEKIFNWVQRSNLRCSPYYFRTLEREFQKAKITS